MSKRFINLMFAFASILIIGLGAFTLVNLEKTKQHNAKVDHTFNVQKKLQLLEREFLVTVAAQRSFLLTKDSLYIDYYTNAKERMFNELKLLHTNIKDNEFQLENSDKLKTAFIKRDSAFTAEVYFDQSNKDRRSKNDQILNNLKFSQDIVAVFRTMQGEEARLMKERIRIETSSRSNEPILIVVFTLSVLAILSQAIYFLNKELSAKNKSIQKTQALIYEINQSNIELERYAYIASHDLKEPMRKMRIYIEHLKNLQAKNQHQANHPTDEKTEKYLHKVDNLATRMTNLITDLLEYSKLQGKTVVAEKLDFGHLFGNKVTEMMEELNVNYTFESDTKDAPFINIGQSQINQLIQNLVDNAVKYRDPAKEVLKLSLRYGKKLDEETKKVFHTFTFSDNGLGFDQEYSSKIFEVFGRLVNKSEISGTGIGLSICKQIMKNHGGNIEAEGEVKKGASFILYFPEA